MDDLNPDRLRELLPDWAADLRCFVETDSTNARALAWARAGAPHGSVVVADYQTAGRGRFDRRWEAPRGQALLLSVVLRPSCESEYRGLLTPAAALALCGCLDAMGVESSIKWPNDILVGDCKVAGVLGESENDVVVVGMGVNVTQTEFPPGLLKPAASLRQVHPGPVDRGRLLAGWVETFSVLADGDPSRVVEELRRRCETLGKAVVIDEGGEIVQDQATDIDPRGGLILRSGRVVASGEVREVRIPAAPGANERSDPS